MQLLLGEVAGQVEDPLGVLAVVQAEQTVYAITGEGRRALGAWLASEPGPPRFELETMLRLVYADQGSKEELLAAVRAARGWAEARYTEGREQVRGYLVDGGPFPDRLHIIALFARFYADLFELVSQWAELAEAEIQAWPSTDGLGMTERTRTLLEELVGRPGPGGAVATRRRQG